MDPRPSPRYDQSHKTAIYFIGTLKGDTEMPSAEELQRRVNELAEIARRYGGVVGLRGEDENADMDAVWVRFERSDAEQIRMLLGDEELVLMNAEALEAAMTDLWSSEDG